MIHKILDLLNADNSLEGKIARSFTHFLSDLGHKSVLVPVQLIGKLELFEMNVKFQLHQKNHFYTVRYDDYGDVSKGRAFALKDQLDFSDGRNPLYSPSFSWLITTGSDLLFECVDPDIGAPPVTMDFHTEPLDYPELKVKASERSTTKAAEDKAIRKKIADLPLSSSTNFTSQGSRSKRNSFLSDLAELGYALHMNKVCPDDQFATTTLQRKTRDLKGCSAYVKQLQFNGYDVSIHPLTERYNTIDVGKCTIIEGFDVKFSPSCSKYKTVPIEAFYRRNGVLDKNGCSVWDHDNDLVYLIGKDYYHVKNRDLRQFIEDHPPTDTNTYELRKWPSPLNTNPFYKKVSSYDHGHSLDKLSLYLQLDTFARLATSINPVPQPIFDRVEAELPTILDEHNDPINALSNPYDFDWLVAVFPENSDIRRFQEKVMLRH